MTVKAAFKIESGIEVPKSRGSGYSDVIRLLKVGQSVVFPGKTAYQVSGIYGNIAKSMKRKFTARTVDGGVRVWRIS
jgi:hypothetical protein